MADAYLSIKKFNDDYNDKRLIRSLNLAGLKLLTALGRSDKAKKVIVQEQDNFTEEISRVFMQNDEDIEI